MLHAMLLTNDRKWSDSGRLAAYWFWGETGCKKLDVPQLLVRAQVAWCHPHTREHWREVVAPSHPFMILNVWPFVGF